MKWGIKDFGFVLTKEGGSSSRSRSGCGEGKWRGDVEEGSIEGKWRGEYQQKGRHQRGKEETNDVA